MVFLSSIVKQFKVDKRAYGSEQSMSEFETELCKNDEWVIAKMYKFVEI